MISPGLEKTIIEALKSSAADKFLDVILAGATAAAVTMRRNHTEHASLVKNEITDLTSVSVTETSYIQQRRGGPRKRGASFSQDVLDRLYYTQIIRNFDSIDLSSAYAKSHYEALARDIKAGMDKCTTENPLPFSHVHMSIDRKEGNSQKNQSYKNALTDPIRNHCSRIFNQNETSYVLQGNASKRRSYENQIWIMPFLFYEPHAVKKQLRLMMTTEADLLAIRTIDPARIKCEGDTENLGQNHIHFDRFRSLKMVSDLYFNPKTNVRAILNASIFATTPYNYAVQQLCRPSTIHPPVLSAG